MCEDSNFSREGFGFDVFNDCLIFFIESGSRFRVEMPLTSTFGDVASAGSLS